MAGSAASTVEQYLDELSPARRAVVSAVRDVVRRHLPAGYAESMGFGMISWELPLTRYPETYNGKPLCLGGLAAQKNSYSLYLMAVYGDPALERRLRAGFAEAGMKLDMGKSCIRFKRTEDLPLDIIGEIIEAVPPDALIAQYERSRRR